MEKALTRIMAVMVVLTMVTLTLGIALMFLPRRTEVKNMPSEGDPDIRSSVIEFARANETLLVPGAQAFGIIDEVWSGDGYTRFETSYCSGFLDCAKCYALILYDASPDLSGYAPHGNGWLCTDDDDTFYLEPITDKLYYRFEAWQ